MKRLAVFASGHGSNFKAILDHVRLGVLENVRVALLVSNDTKAPVIQIARDYSIPHVILEGVFGRKFTSKLEKEVARSEFDERAVETMVEHGIDLLALAGFMQVLGPRIVRSYRYRILNIHPAKDLAKFGGRGMFGERVHAAVLQAGEKESGCTVHFVDESVDGGPVILQSTVPTLPGDTPKSLADRILIQEHRMYSKAIQLHVDERIIVHDGKAFVDWSGGWEEGWHRRQEAFILQQTRALNQNGMLESPPRPV